MKAPFAPKIASRTDTKYFPKLSSDSNFDGGESDAYSRFRETDIRFIGFTYKSFDAVEHRDSFELCKAPATALTAV